MKRNKHDHICVIFPFELGWGQNRPVAQAARVEWLFEKYDGNITVIEPYLRKEYCPGPVSYAKQAGFPMHYRIISAKRHLSSWAAQLVCVPSVLKILKEVKPSIIWSIKPVPVSTLPAWLYCAFNHCFWIADTDDWEGEGGVIELFEQFVYKKAALTTAASLALQNKVKKLAASARAAYLPNAPTKKMLRRLDPAQPGPAHQSLGVKAGSAMILYVGNLYKDAISDIYALAEIAAKLTDLDITWVVVGGGDYLQRAKDYVVEKKLQKHFLFTGPKSWQEVTGYLKAADIVVYFREDNPLQRARSPIKLLEYLSAGKVVVASRVGEAEQMIKHNVSGFLVQPNDIKAAAGAISLLVKDLPLRQRLGQASRAAAVAMNHDNDPLALIKEIVR